MSLTIHIFYTGEGNNARAFAQEMVDSGLVDQIRSRPGNEGYAYYYPAEDAQTVLLIDRWQDQAALDAHHKSPIMEQIAKLRQRYHLHMRVERYVEEPKQTT